MNGVCTDIFKDPAFKDKEGCNCNSDCGPNEHCAGHKCIDKRDLYDYLSSVSEVKDVLLRIAWWFDILEDIELWIIIVICLYK